MRKCSERVKANRIQIQGIIMERRYLYTLHSTEEIKGFKSLCAENLRRSVW